MVSLISNVEDVLSRRHVTVELWEANGLYGAERNLFGTNANNLSTLYSFLPLQAEVLCLSVTAV